MKSSFKFKTKLGVIHLPIIIALLAIIVIPLIIISVKISSKKISVSAATNIDITTQAVQKVYQNGVPHFDKNGNLRTTFDANSSFLPNGLLGITDEAKDQGVLAVLANAGFNFGFTKKGSDVQFFLDQINGVNNYAVAISNNVENPQLQDIVVAEITQSTNIEITNSNLIPGTVYKYYVCTPNCGTGMRISYGLVTAQASTGGQGTVSVSWNEGRNLKLVIDNSLSLDSNKNYDPNTFNANLFNSYKTNLSIFGWFLADEPYKIATVTGNNPTINLNAINQIYNTYKDQTNQPLFIIEGSLLPSNSTWDQFVNIGDFANVYDYPKFFQNFNSVQTVASTVKEMVRAVGQNKPAWTTLQSFNGWPGYPYPSPKEERAQIYTAIIHGATGLLHFAWDSCEVRYSPQDFEVAGIRPNVANTYPDCHPDAKVLSNDEVSQAKNLWNSLDSKENGINKEINELTPVILSPTLRTPYTVSVDQTPISTAPIRTILKAYNGFYYLITVNIDNAPINASFGFTFPIQGPVEKLYEGGQATVVGQAITDSYSPFAVHIYKFPTGNDSDLDTFSNTVETAMGTDPNSNCATLSNTDAFPPDIDRNGVVTLSDITTVSKAYGKTSSMPDWPTYKRYDMDANGTITLADIFLTSKFFGKAFCP